MLFVMHFGWYFGLYFGFFTSETISDGILDFRTGDQKKKYQAGSMGPPGITLY